MTIKEFLDACKNITGTSLQVEEQYKELVNSAIINFKGIVSDVMPGAIRINRILEDNDEVDSIVKFDYSISAEVLIDCSDIDKSQLIALNINSLLAIKCSCSDTPILSSKGVRGFVFKVILHSFDIIEYAIVHIDNFSTDFYELYFDEKNITRHFDRCHHSDYSFLIFEKGTHRIVRKERKGFLFFKPSIKTWEILFETSGQKFYVGFLLTLSLEKKLKRSHNK